MKNKYSIISLIKNSFSYHENWQKAWGDPEPKKEYDIVIIGGGYLFRDTLEITNKLVLTNVNCEIEGDVFYPDIDFNEWQEKSSENFSKDIDNDYDFKVRGLERV